jgi:surface polysaccharide O-acyltransferase-like enzyme
MPFQPFLTEHFPVKAGMLTSSFEFFLALLGIGGVAQIVKWSLTGPIGRWLAWIGKYTLDIYVIHLYTFPYAPFGAIFPQRGDTFNIIVVVAWGLFASITISFLIIRRSVILKLLFLGILDAKKAGPVLNGQGAEPQSTALG